MEVGAAPPRSERVSVDVAGTAIFDFGRGAPLRLPAVHVSGALRPWLLSDLAGAGFGTRETMSSGGASAEMSQQFSVGGASYRLRADRPLRPFLSLAAGVLHTSAQGDATPPEGGQESDQWYFLLDGGAGAW